MGLVRLIHAWAGEECGTPGCSNRKLVERSQVVVLSHVLEIKSDFCRECAQKLLEEWSILCVSCGRPIIPGTAVGSCGPGKYTHHTKECSPPDSYCGTWGEGKLIPVEESHG